MPSKSGAGKAAFVEPMAARVVRELPGGPEWMYELKFDGYRALILKNGASVEIRSRNEKDMTQLYPGVVRAGMQLAATSAVVDGEIVAVDHSGRPSFQALQHRSTYSKHTIAFYAFDLLHLDGGNLTGRPLDERRELLAGVVAGSGLLLSEELPGTAEEVANAVRGLGLEGVLAKRRDSRYLPGHRSDAWLKLKLELQQEFVIGGYRPGPHGIDALLVGFHDSVAPGRKTASGSLRFAGKVRAGFTPHLRREVFAQLRMLHTERCPFDDLPNSKTTHWGGGVTAEQMSEMQWVKPQLVAQIRFVEWTEERHLRHAAFVGLRSDKRAKDVRWEGP